MLTRLLLILSSLLLSFAVESKIIETTRIANAIPYIDENTWFLVDLDNTMFEAKQALGHANWFYDEMQQRILKGMTRNEAIRDFYPSWIKTQALCPVKSLEESFVPSLIALQDQGITVMGLTHRQPAVAKFTVNQVNSLGFDFTKTAPSADTFDIPYENPTTYLKGILFVGDYNEKGGVFPLFLSIIKKTPKKIVFIDDKRKNVEELGVALSKFDIEYIGIYYSAIEYAKPVYSRELAEFQLKYLNEIMSNEDATMLMKHFRF